MLQLEFEGMSYWGGREELAEPDRAAHAREPRAAVGPERPIALCPREMITVVFQRRSSKRWGSCDAYQDIAHVWKGLWAAVGGIAEACEQRRTGRAAIGGLHLDKAAIVQQKDAHRVIVWLAWN